MNRMNAIFLIPALLACTVAVSCSALEDFIPKTDQKETIPTTRVVREPVEVRIHTQGELQPVRTEVVTAPPVSGGTLQIIYIVKSGTYIKKDDIVVQFDPSEQEYSLEQSKSQLDEAERKIKKMRIDQAVRAAREKVSLLSSESAVRRAELTLKENELLSKNQARKNEIAYEEAKRRLEQLKRDIQSNANSDKASLAAQETMLDRARFMMERSQENIRNMIVRAPIDGIVVMGQNIQALLGGGFIVSIRSIPEYKEGDRASPGESIAQIQEIDQVEVHSKVLETDRGNLTPGQPAEIWLDFRPMKPFAGKIKSLAPSANSRSGISSALSMLESLSSRTFDVTLEFDPEDVPIKLGTTARIVIQGQNVDDALSLPRQAIFQKDGRPVVYMKSTDDWQAHNIQVKYLTENRAILEGIDEGAEVALVNPEQNMRGGSQETGPPLSLRPGVNP